MTEMTPAPAEQTEAVERPVVDIEFQGRTLTVHAPTPEQFVIWKRILRTLEGAGDSWNGEQVVNALDRARRLIDTLLVHPADSEWLDDLVLDGKTSMEAIAGIIQLATEALQAQTGNREQRRAAKKSPAKKAARQKAGA